MKRLIPLLLLSGCVSNPTGPTSALKTAMRTEIEAVAVVPPVEQSVDLPYVKLSWTLPDETDNAVRIYASRDKTNWVAVLQVGWTTNAIVRNVKLPASFVVTALRGIDESKYSNVATIRKEHRVKAEAQIGPTSNGPWTNVATVYDQPRTENAEQFFRVNVTYPERIVTEP